MSSYFIQEKILLRYIHTFSIFTALSAKVFVNFRWIANCNLNACLDTLISRCQSRCKRLEWTQVLGGVVTPHKRFSLCIHRSDVCTSVLDRGIPRIPLLDCRCTLYSYPQVPRDPLPSLLSKSLACLEVCRPDETRKTTKTYIFRKCRYSANVNGEA